MITKNPKLYSHEWSNFCYNINTKLNFFAINTLNNFSEFQTNNLKTLSIISVIWCIL